VGSPGITGDPGEAGKQVGDWREFQIFVAGLLLNSCIEVSSTLFPDLGQARHAWNSGSNRLSRPQGMLVYRFINFKFRQF
jgi:hypothetical protein